MIKTVSLLMLLWNKSLSHIHTGLDKLCSRPCLIINTFSSLIMVFLLITRTQKFYKSYKTDFHKPISNKRIVICLHLHTKMKRISVKFVIKHIHLFVIRDMCLCKKNAQSSNAIKTLLTKIKLFYQSNCQKNSANK